MVLEIIIFPFNQIVFVFGLIKKHMFSTQLIFFSLLEFGVFGFFLGIYMTILAQWYGSRTVIFLNPNYIFRGCGFEQESSPVAKLFPIILESSR